MSAWELAGARFCGFSVLYLLIRSSEAVSFIKMAKIFLGRGWVLPTVWLGCAGNRRNEGMEVLRSGFHGSHLKERLG